MIDYIVDDGNGHSMAAGKPPDAGGEGQEATRRKTVPQGFSALGTGTRLERYTIESVIAAGGFGITYAAHHEGLGRLFAIKEHFPRQFSYRDGKTSEVRASDPETFSWALDRFLLEGRALARCKHPNIVDVTDVFEGNGTAYMVLAYEQGQSFKSWLDNLKRLPRQDELDALAGPLLDALSFVHAQGLLHRDIAPDNILVRTDGTPCLIDFGASRQAIAQRSQVMSAIVKTGYSPPEQYTTDGRSQGPWSDIYAMGATLYRALAGNAPAEATARTIGDTVVPLAATVPQLMIEGYRPEFLAAIDQAIALLPRNRPQSVADWKTALFAEPRVSVESANVPGEPAGNSNAEPGRPSERVGVSSIAAAATITGAPGASLPEPARPVMLPLGIAGAVVLAGVLIWSNVGRPRTPPTAVQPTTAETRPVAAASSVAPERTSGAGAELFPLFGVTIGRTSATDLAKKGKVDCDGKCVVINGFNFWHHNDAVFHHMYLTRGGKLPDEWTRLGLSFSLSYQEWLGLFERLGFTLTIKVPPKIDKYQDRDSFTAEIEGRSTKGVPLTIGLDFSLSKKTGEATQGTLYSIRLRAAK